MDPNFIQNLDLSFIKDLLIQFFGSAAGAAGSAMVARRRARDGRVVLDERTRSMLERTFQSWLESERERVHVDVGDVHIIVAQSVNVIESGAVALPAVAAPAAGRPAGVGIPAIMEERNRRIRQAAEQRGGFEE